MGREPVIEVVRNLHERMARIADEARSALHDAEQDLPEDMQAVGQSWRKHRFVRVTGLMGALEASPEAEEAAAALDDAAGDLLEAAGRVLISTRKRGDEIDAALAQLRQALAQRPGA